MEEHYNIKDALQDLAKEKNLTIEEIEKECGFSDGYFKSTRYCIPESSVMEILKKYPEFKKIGLSDGPLNGIISNVVGEIQTAQKEKSGILGIPTGYTNLDNATFGLHPAELTIIASRPSVGKTAFLLNMARNLTVDHKISVAFFSTESSCETLMRRMMLSETGLLQEKLTGAEEMTQDEWAQLECGIWSLSYAPLWIDDTPGMPLNQLVQKIKKLRSEQKIQLAIVDCLQMVNGPFTPYPNREQEITAICRKLKETAMELNMPIVVASHLNRSVEARGGNKKPQLSDLRESGAIEQIADVVMFIHRPEFLGVQDEGGFPGETDIIIAKNRNGETGEVKMRFLSSEVKFVDYNDRPYNEPVQDSPADYTTVQSRMNELNKDDFEL